MSDEPYTAVALLLGSEPTLPVEEVAELPSDPICTFWRSVLLQPGVEPWCCDCQACSPATILSYPGSAVDYCSQTTIGNILH